MSFLSGLFLSAMVAAAGPPLIHLFNRRRYRTVPWAAMSFLQQALEQTRRSVRVRDLLLMVLRTLVIVLFVLAMARPVWVGGQAMVVGDQPVHALVVIDNSLSMGYRRLDRTLLDRAKAKAAAAIDQLPAGSAVSVIPMCLGGQLNLPEVCRTKSAAKDALESIPLVDQRARANRALDKARALADQFEALANKRLIVFSDQQRLTWYEANLDRDLDSTGRVHLVNVSGEVRTNSWVGSVWVRDEFASGDKPTMIVAEIRHEGQTSREDVPVRLRVNGSVVARRTIDLSPGESVMVRFEHRFDAEGRTANPLMRAVSVGLASDRLPEDDRRYAAVPVIDAVPVVFIDRLGQDEDPSLSLYGQTYPLRRLLAPASTHASTSRTNTGKPIESSGSPFEVRHRKPQQVTRGTLAHARLVVVAGISEPSSRLVHLLGQYTEQGGMLLIGAGGNFDPAAWTDVAWQAGEGILPRPLDSAPIGAVPAEQAKHPPTSASSEPEAVQAFGLAPETFTDKAFQLGLSKPARNRLLSTALFFKAVKIKAPSGNQNSGARVMGRYDTGDPFAVRRPIGQGLSVMVSTGFFPRWNTLGANHAVILFDRLMRYMLGQTMPRRNLNLTGRIAIAVDGSEVGQSFNAYRPDQPQPGTLSPEARDDDRYALILRHVFQRGMYRIRPTNDQPLNNQPADMFALNGPSAESDLTPAKSQRWAGANDAVSSAVRGSMNRSLWKWPLGLSLLLLLTEMTLLASRRIDGRGLRKT